MYNMSAIVSYFTIRIKMVCQRMYYKHRFQDFGKRSLILKPDRIVGGNYVTIGRSVRILQHLRMEAIDRWRDQVFQPQITIGDGTTLEQNCHIVAADKLEIGRDVTISAQVFISDTEHEYRKTDTNIHQQPLHVKPTRIGDFCFIGYGAVIQAGTTLGKHCIVGSNAVVKGEFDDYCVLAGVPAKVIKKYNKASGQWERVSYE